MGQEAWGTRPGREEAKGQLDPSLRQAPLSCPALETSIIKGGTFTLFGFVYFGTLLDDGLGFKGAGDGRGSFLLGAVCCIEGSHVPCSRDEVDDTNDGLEQGNGSCDPEAHSEKPHRAD